MTGWFSDRKQRREFMRRLRVTELERDTGFQLSYPEMDLPTIRVVRNPHGFEWEPWVALGFGGDEYLGTFDNGYVGAEVGARSKGACIAAAKEKLYQIALAKSEHAEAVTL